LLTLFSPCPRGLETPLAAELIALGAEIRQEVPGGVLYQVATPADSFANEDASLQASWALVYRVNLWSRIASRVLIQLDQGFYKKERDLYDIAVDIPWEAIMHPSQTLRIDTSATKSPLKSLNFANLLIKDAICDRLREHAGDRPSINTEDPDVRVFLFLEQFRATLYVDSSGQNLFKRGWRHSEDKGTAPIKENLAAGLIALSGWTPDQSFADIFCGSGTLAIEAAQQAHGIAPGLQREFAFQKLAGFDEALWDEQLQHAHVAMEQAKKTRERAHNSATKSSIQGSDLDANFLPVAHANMIRAGLPAEAIQWSVSAAEAASPLHFESTGVLISNPPYGERMGPSFDPVALGQNLREGFAGWRACLITTERDLPGQIRLREYRKYPLFNGALECRLFCFQMRSANPVPL
jgi:putative N6-adenine-specific DNA methylase